jgi:UDP-N-acetylmuramate dehydrogenase
MMEHGGNDHGSATGPEVRTSVPLAPLTTLDLGGPAASLIEINHDDAARDAVRWARAHGQALAVLAGGSNTVVADAGFDGCVLWVRTRAVTVTQDGDSVLVDAAAGEDWDELVKRTVGEGLTGLECLSGIPGSVGATPIQNVGAYGQEVASVIEAVRVLDLGDLTVRTMDSAACGFGYRTSVFRRRPGRFLVLGVRYRLRRGRPGSIGYRELADRLAAVTAPPAPRDVRDAVLELRRAKSMVLDDGDPNRRSVGSFFVNPVVGSTDLERIAAAAGAEPPQFAVGEDRIKVPAAWLIERSGFHKGLERGGVGISSAHTLALVHLGGGSTADLLELAREIRDGVRRRFGVELRPEPVFVGFDRPNPLD